MKSKITGYYNSDGNAKKQLLDLCLLINTYPCDSDLFGFLPAIPINMSFSVFPCGHPHTKQGLCEKKDPIISKEGCYIKFDCFFFIFVMNVISMPGFYLIKGAEAEFFHGLIQYFYELKQLSFFSEDFHTKEGPA